MSQKIKVEAKDVTSAISKGLKKLGLRRDQVEVTVLTAPRKGFLGIGARDAVVELRAKRWSTADLDSQIYMDVPKRKPRRGGARNTRKGHGGSSVRSYRNTRKSHGETSEPRERTPKANEKQLLPCERIQNAVIPDNLKGPMQEAKEHLEQVLTHMGIKVENLNAWWDEKQQRILLTFDCDHPAIVIGKEGKTLEAIQYLSTLSLSRHFDTPISVITDTQNYWRKAEDKIDAEIEKGISLIKSGHSIFRFRPMSAQLRRYIHRAMEGNEYVTTSSEGEGKWRKVTLRPTEKIAELLNANKAPADFVPGVIGEDIAEVEQIAMTDSTDGNIPAVEETTVAIVEEITPVQTAAATTATPAQDTPAAVQETAAPVATDTPAVSDSSANTPQENGTTLSEQVVPAEEKQPAETK